MMEDKEKQETTEESTPVEETPVEDTEDTSQTASGEEDAVESPPEGKEDDAAEVKEGTEETAPEAAEASEETPEKAKVVDEDAGKTEPEDTTPKLEMKWYVVHTYSGHENKVRENIIKMIQTSQIKAQFGQLVVPTEEVAEMKKGKKTVTTRKFFPSYILIEMHMTDESWHLVNSIPGVTSFVGAGMKPQPLSQPEVERILGRMDKELDIGGYHLPVDILDSGIGGDQACAWRIDRTEIHSQSVDAVGVGDAMKALAGRVRLFGFVSPPGKPSAETEIVAVRRRIVGWK